MRSTIRHCMSAALCMLLGAAHAQTDTGSPPRGLAVRVEKDSAAARVVAMVYQGRFSYVRIETRENGAALNQHPLNITAEALRKVLEQAELVDDSPGSLFTPKQLDEITAPLAAALARATPEQDVSVAVSDQVGWVGPLAPRLVTTARVFQRDGQLQLITGLVRRDFESQYRGSGYLIAFEPGQRAKPVDAATRLRATNGNGSSVRTDWLALTTAVSTPTSATVPVAATPSQPNPAATDPPAAAPPARAGGATAAPAAAAPPAPGREGDALYRSAAERLRALEKLRADGLISEAEFQEKRKQILREL